jgi:hypothetical protein
MKHRLCSLYAIAAALVSVTTLVKAETTMFSGNQLGTLPKTFETALTGQGKAGRWEVVKDATATGGYALAQLSADPTDNRFPLAIYTPVNATNVEIVTRFKAVSGKVDQAGGVVVRFLDPNNYYVARANATEDNVRFYRVVGGNRQQLASMNAKVKPGEWHTLTLRAEGDRFTVLFDGNPPMAASDKTFRSAGKTGLWTKADSVTHFDRPEVKVLP